MAAMKTEFCGSEDSVITLESDEDEIDDEGVVQILSPPPHVPRPPDLQPAPAPRKDRFSTIMNRDFNNRQPSRIFIFNPRSRPGLPKCGKCKKVFLSEQSVSAHSLECRVDPTTYSVSEPAEAQPTPIGRTIILTKRHAQTPSLPMPPLKRGVIGRTNKEEFFPPYPNDSWTCGPEDSSHQTSLSPVGSGTERDVTVRTSERIPTPPLPIFAEEVIVSEMDSPEKSIPKRRKPRIVQTVATGEANCQRGRKKRAKEPPASQDEEAPLNLNQPLQDYEIPKDFFESFKVDGRFPRFDGGVCCDACSRWLFLPGQPKGRRGEAGEEEGMTREVAEFLGHEEKEWFQCPQCPLLFRHLISWHRHISKKHESYTFYEHRWSCTMCPRKKMKSCYSQEMLLLHRLRAHTHAPSPLILPKTQAYSGHLIRKLTVKPKSIKQLKQGIFKNECPFPTCGMKFKQKQQLDEHWWSSHGACPYCSMPCRLPLIFRLHSQRCSAAPRPPASTIGPVPP